MCLQANDTTRLASYFLGVGLAAEIVFAASAWAVGFIDEDVIVASGADNPINRFGELLVRGGGFVIGACLFAAAGHRDFILT
jgi:hypothetical protein